MKGYKVEAFVASFSEQKGLMFIIICSNETKNNSYPRQEVYQVLISEPWISGI
jgi:hypothetical protein